MSSQNEFEFSFYNVYNPDAAPSFYIAWDDGLGDYVRFGFYNESAGRLAYRDNDNLLLETGYASNLYSYDIYADGDFGYHTKIEVADVGLFIANDSYNEGWSVMINVMNSTDPAPCFGYDVLSDDYTRITRRDLASNALWSDDGRAMNWKLNGAALPGWHSLAYLNLTDNSTENRLSEPYYLHFPFVAAQEQWVAVCLLHRRRHRLRLHADRVRFVHLLRIRPGHGPRLCVAGVCRVPGLHHLLDLCALLRELRRLRQSALGQRH